MYCCINEKNIYGNLHFEDIIILWAKLRLYENSAKVIMHNKACKSFIKAPAYLIYSSVLFPTMKLTQGPHDLYPME